MVLYRGIREGGFSFFTNYESRKGKELAGNPFAAMLFYWPRVGKQVRLEGQVERLSSSVSDVYFQSRPFRSQVTAAVSPQSRPLLDEGAFRERLTEVENSSGGRIVRPPEWGGYKLIPSLFEFWTHGDHRRHERVQFQGCEGGWMKSKLYP
jgi:pyridoxamine 5'-phosphate oxidase